MIQQDNSLLNGRIQLIEVACNFVLGYEGDLVITVLFIYLFINVCLCRTAVFIS